MDNAEDFSTEPQVTALADRANAESEGADPKPVRNCGRNPDKPRRSGVLEADTNAQDRGRRSGQTCRHTKFRRLGRENGIDLGTILAI